MPGCGCGQDASDAVVWLHVAVAAVVIRLIRRGVRQKTDANEGGGMSETTQTDGKSGRLLIVAILIAAVIGVVVVKNRGKREAAGSNVSEAGLVARSPAGESAPGAAATEKLPTLIDLGADLCLPCKMMVPVLHELQKEYAGRMEVVFLDVWENPGVGEKYGVRMIPTQIFYNAEGKELFRHEGFMSKEDILKKWRELEVDLEKEEGTAPKAETTSFLPILPDNSGCGA
ncbi:MAG: thioredoxin family protein [Planctomycetota bacterium]